MTVNLELFLQLTAAIGSFAALAGLLKVRSDNKKTHAETVDLEDQINERVFQRMERLNKSLMERLISTAHELESSEKKQEQERAKRRKIQENFDILEERYRILKDKLDE